MTRKEYVKLGINKETKIPSRTQNTIEIKNTHSHVEQFIDMMDERCINELCSGGYITDIDKIYDIIEEETDRIINLDGNVNHQEINYIPNLKAGYEEYLRKMSLPYFACSCLPDYQITPHTLEWLNMIMMYPRLCVLAARDHSKSFTFSYLTILWDMYRYTKRDELTEPPIDILNCRESMLITNEFKLAKKLLKKVKSEIENNQILSEKMYPGRFAEGWSKESLMTKNGAELTLSSFHSSNRGPHPGRITVDDFLDRSALYSKDARDKFVESFGAEVMNMIVPSGRVRVVATPFHSDDLYSKIKQMNGWFYFEYPAIFPDGSILWADRYDFSSLMEKRKNFGNLIFSREFLVRPISDSVSIFPYSILENAKIGMENVKMCNNIQSYPIKMKKVVLGCDFSLSATASADFSVFVALGLDEYDRIHVMNCTRFKGKSHDEQIAIIQRMDREFRPNVVVMENNGFQRILASMARQAGVKNVLEFTTSGFNKRDFISGLPSLAVLFERGEIKIGQGDEHSLNMYNIICQEFNGIVFDEDKNKLENPNHDDTCMAIFFGVTGIRNISKGFKISMVGNENNWM